MAKSYIGQVVFGEAEREMAENNKPHKTYFNETIRIKRPSNEYEREDLMREAEEETKKAVERIKKLPSLAELQKKYGSK